MSDKDKPYEVGYGKPPKETQFKKGQSGNLKGREKGTKNFGTLFRDGLNKTIIINENGEEKHITVREAIVKRVLVDAMKGKSKATEQVLKINSHQLREENLTEGAMKKLDASLDSLSIEELDELIIIINSVKK